MKIGQSVFAAMVAVSGFVGMGCSSEPEYPVTPTPTYTAPPVATTTAPPVAQVMPCDAVQQANLAAAIGQRAVGEATGMQPKFNVCGNVPEGGTVSSEAFYIDASVCYTAIANGFPNVTEVDAQLVIDPTVLGLQPALAQMAAQPLASDSDVGAMARINCYKYQMLFAAPVKLVVRARQGAGVVGGALFTKKI